MNDSFITGKDDLVKVIYANYRILFVLDRFGIKLGHGGNSISEVAGKYSIDEGALLLVMNLFCHNDYTPDFDEKFEYIPDLLKYLKSSHVYFLKEKIPSIQKNIQELVAALNDSKAEMVELFYKNYINEVAEHIEYENNTVFPYIERLYNAYEMNKEQRLDASDYAINIYGEHHEDIEDVLRDLKNILLRHLPQSENGKFRRNALLQLFELESDLYSHTRIENEVLIPLVKVLEDNIKLALSN